MRQLDFCSALAKVTKHLAFLRNPKSLVLLLFYSSPEEGRIKAGEWPLPLCFAASWQKSQWFTCSKKHCPSLAERAGNNQPFLCGKSDVYAIKLKYNSLSMHLSEICIYKSNRNSKQKDSDYFLSSPFGCIFILGWGMNCFFLSPFS